MVGILVLLCKWFMAMRTKNARSGCPINLAVEILGDRWSLVILRDIMFGGRTQYRELLRLSDEGISSNILADRLKKLVASGMLTRSADDGHKQKGHYRLTEKSISLVPLFAHLGAWGTRWLPATEQLSIRAKLLEEGGAELWERFMTDLRADHLGTPRAPGPTVAEELQAAFDEVRRQSSP